MPLDGMKGLINNLQAFDFGQEMQGIVHEYVDVLADLQREQMSEGRGVDGEYIRPFYSEDPYFKTAFAAEKYAEWKQKITPNPKRPKDVPNLFINGYFYSTLRPKLVASVFEIDSPSSLGEKVLEEHPTAQGLNAEKRKEFADMFTLPGITTSLREKTGLEITQR